MRKPRSLNTRFVKADFFCDADRWRVDLYEPMPLDSRDAERLAAWLFKAAEWIREQEQKR